MRTPKPAIQRILVSVLVFAFLLPCFNLQIHAVGQMTNCDVLNRMNQYINAVNQVSTPHWNRGQKADTLKEQVDRNDFTSCLTNSAAFGDSNNWNETWTCHGFSRYMLYVIYGVETKGYNPIKSNSNFTIYEKGTPWPGLQPGDYINWSSHAAIVYGVNEKDELLLIDCNTDKDYAVVHAGVTVLKDSSNYTQSWARKMYENGSLFIARYSNLTGHDYTATDIGRCSCGYDYPLSKSVYDQYSTVIKVNGTKTAPAHSAPYGAASIERRYALNDTVKIVAGAFNAFGNYWLQLIDGTWMERSYLDGHICLSDKCPLCTNGLTVESMNNTPFIVTKADVWGHTAPYRDSAHISFPKDTRIVVNAKTINKQGNLWYRTIDGVWFYENNIIFDPDTNLGIIEAPTDMPSSGGPSSGGVTSVSLNYPTERTYLNKISVSDTNAVLCINIRKPGGSKCTQAGINIYNAATSQLVGTLTENVTNVNNSLTSFHAWYDLNSELNITLTPGTTYNYYFFTVVDGATYFSDTYSFTTTGTAPSSSSEAADLGSGFIGVILNTASRYCLDHIGEGCIIRLNPERQIAGQKWYFLRASNGNYVIANCETGEMLAGNGDSNGSPLSGNFDLDSQNPDSVIARCRWSLIPYGDGYIIRNEAFPNQVIDIYNNDSFAGAIMQTWERNNSAAQIWTIYTGSENLIKSSFDLNYSLSENKVNLSWERSYGAYYQVVLHNKNLADTDSNYAKEYDAGSASSFELTLAPGKYEVSIRAKNAFECQYSETAAFEIKGQPGQTVLELRIDNPTLWINGEATNIDAQGTKPIIRDSRTLLPIRAIVEALGGTITWDGKNRAVTIYMDGKMMLMTIDSKTVLTSDGIITLDTAPIILNDRTMLPIRAFAEYFGATVEWDGSIRMVTIIK